MLTELAERWDELGPLLFDGTYATLYMVGWSTLFTALFGLPLGVLLYATERGRLLPAPWLRAVLGAIVNIGRSVPFIVLMVAVLTFTRFITGTTIGPTAAIVPLTLGAIPFYARLVETSLREVGRDVIEAAEAMGAGRGTIVAKVLLPEALPGLIAGLTVTVVALVSYSAMAGAIGGGGLGDVAIRFGYQRFDELVLLLCVVLLVVVVQLLQSLGDLAARRLSHR
ncbi:methionine ABC transporter permease [Allonocardiopsis opalescens]|uniref:D-methionine transport system permease protein n=1 Tax=Allonocardiopsis opalescens TaxID=1144618 RepID=A0A2T0Q0K1_9ACTN|nr:methionine ABC transporter permease [Allonocardiopsis opalescens]PRX97203.1 D-methionine transport system permease protein [Allonocardiopsis opalescens]